MKTYKFKINGNEYNVAINSLAGGIADVTVNGSQYQVEMADAPAAPVQQTVAPVQVAPVQASAPVSAAGKPVVSPLPGVIIAVKVNVGDVVKAGQTVAVLEAMKMENDIQAECDGVVTSVNVVNGDSVLEGAELVTIAYWKMMENTEYKINKVHGFLEENGIDYQTHRHPPLPTIELALEYWKEIDSTHCKNLFFRNHKGNRHYLVVFECHKELGIHALEKSLKQGKLSFASQERMERCLGLLPGSVSPFGLINDMNLVQETADGLQPCEGVSAKELFENGHRVKLFLDADLQAAERLSFHPCDNTASTVVTNEGFRRFLKIWGGDYEWITVGEDI